MRRPRTSSPGPQRQSASSVPANARGHPQVFGREWLRELDGTCPLLEAGRKALQMSDGQRHRRARFVAGSVIIEDEQGTRV